MCGINGFNFVNKKILQSMNNSLKHRGPDDEGSFVDNKNKISLGHRRLSIIDLSERGHQPMFYSKEFGACSEKYNKKNLSKSKICITYNGEIYNFQELKKELQKRGYKFNSESDTEVILASYLEYGVDCVKKFNGMWAFCIYDIQKQKLFLSRDRFGQKPLYFYFDGISLIFSSEVKSILKNKLINVDLDRGSFLEYFHSERNISFVSESMLSQIKTVPPSTNLVFDISKRIMNLEDYYFLTSYLDEKIYFDNLKKYEKDLIEELDFILNESVKKHMVSDVEVSSICSGGLDSSLITAIAKKYNSRLKVYCVDTCDKRTSEIGYARKVSNYLNLELREIKIKKEYFEEKLKEVTKCLEYPLVHPNTVAIYLLFKKIKEENIKVVLTGEGSDEIFGGYTSSVQINLINNVKVFLKKLNINFERFFLNNKNSSLFISLFSPLINSKKINELFTYGNFFNPSLEDGFYFYKKKFGGNYLYSLEKNYSFLKDKKYPEMFLTKQMSEYLIPLLKRADKMGMAHGVEVRIPFLDDNLMRFAINLPIKYKINFLERKYLLKKVAERYLPKEIVYRKKSGFPLPFKKWYGVEESNYNLKEKFFEEFEKIFLK
jgi:asparagine synthase (glutamine-hydrolysing)